MCASASRARCIAHAEKTLGRLRALTGDGKTDHRCTPSAGFCLRTRALLRRCRASESGDDTEISNGTTEGNRTTEQQNYRATEQQSRAPHRRAADPQTNWHLHDGIPSAIRVRTAAPRDHIAHHGEIRRLPAHRPAPPARDTCACQIRGAVTIAPCGRLDHWLDAPGASSMPRSLASLCAGGRRSKMHTNFPNFSPNFSCTMHSPQTFPPAAGNLSRPLRG